MDVFTVSFFGHRRIDNMSAIEEKSDYQKNSEHYLNYYDEVEICTESANVHYKAAIQHRNKSIIDRSDLAVFYVERDGGAYKTMKYAEKSNCRILRLNKSVSDIE